MAPGSQRVDVAKAMRKRCWRARVAWREKS
jgi:hypothetical protein